MAGLVMGSPSLRTLLFLLAALGGVDSRKTRRPTPVPSDNFSPTAAPTPRPTWQLDAVKSWKSGSDMAYTIAKDLMTIVYTSNPMPSVTQCFTGNERYLSERVLCDRQCMTNTEEVASASGEGYAGRDPPYRYLAEQCNGPWYCARTEVCETFVNPEASKGSKSPLKKKCTVVLGCANHSQCFPTDAQAAAMNIQFEDDDAQIQQERVPSQIKRASGEGRGKQARWVQKPFEMRYGGITVKTTCCANDDKFEVDVDMPCNGAAGLADRYLWPLAATAAAAGALLLGA